MTLQPYVTDAKDIFSFATVNDGWEEVKLMEFSNKFYMFCETFKEIVFKMLF